MNVVEKLLPTPPWIGPPLPRGWNVRWPNTSPAFRPSVRPCLMRIGDVEEENPVVEIPRPIRVPLPEPIKMPDRIPEKVPVRVGMPERAPMREPMKVFVGRR